jgi:hypothetical protein
MKNILLLLAVVLTLGVLLAAAQQVNTFCAENLPCTISGSWTYSVPIVSSVTTGTAPLSINSTTQVTNLNASQLGGLNPPASAFLGLTDTQSPTNKTLIGASSGNSVTLLNAQANSAAVTGTGSAVTLYTYSVPASDVANLKGIRVHAGWVHSVGSALVTYTLTLNGVAIIGTLSDSGLNGNGAVLDVDVLNTGATTGTVKEMCLNGSLGSVETAFTNNVSGLNWSSNQTLQFTFSVASSDKVTPVFWLVELIQ